MQRVFVAEELHVHDGYMVGTTYHLESFFDVGERDVF